MSLSWSLLRALSLLMVLQQGYIYAKPTVGNKKTVPTARQNQQKKIDAALHKAQDYYNESLLTFRENLDRVLTEKNRQIQDTLLKDMVLEHVEKDYESRSFWRKGIDFLSGNPYKNIPFFECHLNISSSISELKGHMNTIKKYEPTHVLCTDIQTLVTDLGSLLKLLERHDQYLNDVRHKEYLFNTTYR